MSNRGQFFVTEKAAMQAVLAPTKSAGGAIDAELFAAVDASKDDAIPQKLPLKFRSLHAWRSVRSFDKAACGGHALRIARRISQKGSLVPRKAKGAAVAAVLAAGTGTNDMGPVGDKDHFLGDVITQTGVGAAVAQMRRALDDGKTVHSRVLSGIGHGISKTATGATTSSAAQHGGARHRHGGLHSRAPRERRPALPDHQPHVGLTHRRAS